MTQQLHAAITESTPDAVEKLLRKGADANLVINADWSRYKYNGNAYHAVAAIQHADFDERDVRILREIGYRTADINGRNHDNRTPLHVAASVRRKYPASALAVRALIGRGADVHARDSDQCTALHILCADKTSGEAALGQVATVLLDSGARIDDKMTGGITPLMLAASSGHADLYALLAQKGANIHARDIKGLRASDHARAAGHYALADTLKKREDETPETKPSFDSTIDPKVEWKKLYDDRIARTMIEDPLQYKITEIFNFRVGTYTCITQNLVTKIEAVNVRTFDELADNDLIAMAAKVLENKGGHADNRALSAAYRSKKTNRVQIDKKQP